MSILRNSHVVLSNLRVKSPHSDPAFTWDEVYPPWVTWTTGWGVGVGVGRGVGEGAWEWEGVEVVGGGWGREKWTWIDSDHQACDYTGIDTGFPKGGSGGSG